MPGFNGDFYRFQSELVDKLTVVDLGDYLKDGQAILNFGGSLKGNPAKHF
jgi:hypothetical protein